MRAWLAASVAVLGVSATAMANPALASSSRLTVTEASLIVTPMGAGAPGSATLVLTASRPITARSVGVAARDSSGAQYTFPGSATHVGLGLLPYAFRSGSRALTAGTYSVFGFWQDTSGAYHHLASIVPTVVVAASKPVPTGIAGAWTLKQADEFSASSLDTTRWRSGWFGSGVTGPVNTSEQACYSSNNVALPGDGSAHLKITPTASTCGGSPRPYSGALLSTNPLDGRASGGYQYTYGAMEARVYVPASNGQIANWPAVWTDGQNWPADGENDVLEGLSGRGCFHFHSPAGGPGSCPSGARTGWHTFGSDWEPGKVTYYYDGAQVGQISTGITASPMYLILDNTVSATFGGPTMAPADMRVDYVRVWQH